jgi:hypothetical protein
MQRLRLITLALVALVVLAVPAAASARSRDRDRDHMPDRWEKQNGLNTHRNDARRDPDRDGLSNIAEFRHGTDPRNADSDDDGTNDGTEVDEHTNPDNGDDNPATHDQGDDDQPGAGERKVSGTVDSFDSATGTLVIKVTGTGELVSGTLNDGTRIKCENEGAPAGTAPRHGDGDNSGPGNSGDDGDDNGDNGNEGPGNQGDHNGDEQACTTADLTPGAAVDEAELRSGTAPSWDEVELHK